VNIPDFDLVIYYEQITHVLILIWQVKSLSNVTSVTRALLVISQVFINPTVDLDIIIIIIIIIIILFR